jgi:SAM-dependent methyltransferase
MLLQFVRACFLFVIIGHSSECFPKEYSIHNYPLSALANRLLGRLSGIEIGAAAHNPFGLRTWNVDYSDDPNNAFKQHEVAVCGTYAKVDIVAAGDAIPLPDNSVDFVINSHVIEHFYDPVKAIKEWLRLVRPGGYVFMIVPHKERTPDKDRPRTPLAEIIDRHEHPNPPAIDLHHHYSVWITEDFLEICNYYGWSVVAVQDVDDKVGNGFTVVLRK